MCVCIHVYMYVYIHVYMYDYSKNATSTWLSVARSSSSAMLYATYVAEGMVIVNSATANIKTQFSQGVATAANTTVKAGTYIKATKIS